FFVWSIEEVTKLLGEDDAKIAIEYFGMTPRGNFEGHNILYVPNQEATAAERLNMSMDDLRAALARIKDRLYAARTHRVHPGLDDKILTGWNGLMLASLAEAARTLGREDYRQAAVRAGDFLLDKLVRQTDGGVRVLRTYNYGQAKLNGVLEDYACLADAMIELYMTTFDVRYFETARGLAETVLGHFRTEDGGFFDVSDDHEALIVRPRSLQDNAVPSGGAMMARVLFRLAAYTGDERYDEAATGVLRLLANAMGEYPQAFGEALGAAEMRVAGMQELALVGSLMSNEMKALRETAFRKFRPN